MKEEDKLEEDILDDNLKGRQPHSTKISNEDDLTGIQPHKKTTSKEDFKSR